MSTHPGQKFSLQLKSIGAAVDWLSVLFALLGLATGVGSALAVFLLGPLALAAILPISLFAASILSPVSGLLSLIFVTYTQSSNILIKFHGLPSVAQPLAAMLLASIVFRMTIFGDRPSGIARAIQLLMVYGFMGLLSLFYADSYSNAQSAFISYIKDTLSVVIVAFLLQKPSQMKWAAWGLLMAGIFMGSISVFQYLTHSLSNNFWGFGGWESHVAGEVTRQRLTGPFSNPNAYAQALVTLVPIGLDRLWAEKKWPLRLAAFWAVSVCCLTVTFTYSRGGFITLLFVLALFAWERRWRILPLLSLAIMALLLSQFLPQNYTARLTSLTELFSTSEATLNDPSFRGRLSENTAAIQMFLDHPILGVGLDNYQVHYQTYSRRLGIDERRDARSPASLYLEVLSEQGLVGSAIFLLFMGMIFRDLWRAGGQFKQAQQPEYAGIAAALWIGLAGYMFSAIFKNSAYSNSFWLLIGIILATTQTARQTLDEYRQANKSPLASGMLRV